MNKLEKYSRATFGKFVMMMTTEVMIQKLNFLWKHVVYQSPSVLSRANKFLSNQDALFLDKQKINLFCLSILCLPWREDCMPLLGKFLTF